MSAMTNSTPETADIFSTAERMMNQRGAVAKPAAAAATKSATARRRKTKTARAKQTTA